MPISDLCSKKLISLERGALLQEAAHLMKKHHVGGVVVIEGSGKNRPVGILTDRDIVLGVFAESRPLNMRVEDIMSKDVATVKKNEGIAAVVEKMENKGVRRMVIVDEAGKACGLVSSDDILQLVAKELNGLGKLVQHQSEMESL